MSPTERPEFVDTHVHFWDQLVPGLRYDWLTASGDPEETAVLGEYGAIRSEKYLPEDFRRETRSVVPKGVVHVQAAGGSPDPVAESDWLAAARRRTGLPTAFIGDARLDDPVALERTLARHRRHSGFRGIRDLQLSRYLSESGCAESLGVLDREELILCDADALSRLDETLALVRRHEGLTYCVDHAMMPLRRDREYFTMWRTALSKVARLPNTVIKVSGLGQVDHDWTVDSLRPWIQACLEIFGADRVVFGTNWPVDRLYSSYADVVDAYVEACEELTADERTAVLSGNAWRLFGLDG
ncbi:amidohydrolase family protein [Nocardioides sp. AE5]|uniref:amidohydrolase family protein n=1 Tax=Nocardioides sp. AE5 TaxID=2962573 RepID=UPI002881D86E|nr:amidohydrolase family protein [Nocardioides sp. AE5]MDT0203153.1 amidohydrolase family protein [Nocardioides sp. AE5]